VAAQPSSAASTDDGARGGSGSLAPSNALTPSSIVYAIAALPVRLVTTVLGACMWGMAVALDASMWVALQPVRLVGWVLETLTAPLSWLGAAAGVAPSQLVGGAGSWLAASLWLRHSGWEHPLVCGAFVALGMQEVVEFVSVLLPWGGATHDT
jgi:hypothetical protein